MGSPNVDMRSSFLDDESAVCVYSPDAIASVRDFIDELSARCSPVAPVFREHRVVEQLALRLAPEL